MFKRFLPILAFVSCSAQAPAVAVEPPKECVGPPGEFQHVKLAMCRSNNDYVACAYVFLTADAQVCWAVLAQPRNNCYEPFAYVTTTCAEKEDDQAPEVKKSDWRVDPRDDEFWDVYEDQA
jgi:hypothetical protein